MALDFTEWVGSETILRAIYEKLYGTNSETPQKIQLVANDGSDRSAVCGGTELVTPSATAFAQPSFIECAGADGTITGVDEYGNTVTAYPMTVGKITVSRWNKVTAVSSNVVVWRHYTV